MSLISVNPASATIQCGAGILTTTLTPTANPNIVNLTYLTTVVNPIFYFTYITINASARFGANTFPFINGTATTIFTQSVTANGATQNSLDNGNVCFGLPTVATTTNGANPPGTHVLSLPSPGSTIAINVQVNSATCVDFRCSTMIVLTNPCCSGKNCG